MRASIVLSIFLALALFSCREEYSIYETEENQPGLEANSNAAGLMQNVSLNDGSFDNIIDNTSNITVKLPVTVFANGIRVDVVTEEDFATIERIFDEFDDDEDVLQIVYPVTVILSDFSEIQIENEDEFDELKSRYENGLDDDIECIDFVFPVNVSVFDVVTEQLDNLTLNNDEEMFRFLDEIDKDDIVNIEFPVSMVLSDGTTVRISNLNELETAIINAEGTCDEDDEDDGDDGNDGDGDGDDDGSDDVDDDDPLLEQAVEILTSCDKWVVDAFVVNDNEMEDDYEDYTFSFTADNKFIAQKEGTVFSGTWDSYKNGENIIVVIKLPELPGFTTSWSLDEFEQDDDGAEVEFSKGENILQFSSTCS